MDCHNPFHIQRKGFFLAPRLIFVRLTSLQKRDKKLIWENSFRFLIFKQKNMIWEQLLSLQRFGDTTKRIRKEQDEIRLGFEVDYDRIVFSSYFRSLQRQNTGYSFFQNRFCPYPTSPTV